MHNGVVAKAQPMTTMPNLLNNFLFTTNFQFTKKVKKQCLNGNVNLIITQMPKAKTLLL